MNTSGRCDILQGVCHVWDLSVQHHECMDAWTMSGGIVLCVYNKRFLSFDVLYCCMPACAYCSEHTLDVCMYVHV